MPRRWRGALMFILVAALVPYGPLLDIGAGTGALATALRERGCRVLATDAFASHGKPGWHGSLGRVVKAEASRAARACLRVPRLNMLCTWPAMESWCGRGVALLPVGRAFAYVGEGYGGCTGGDALHDLLDDKFAVELEVDVPRFEYVHDRLVIYRRTRE